MYAILNIAKDCANVCLFLVIILLSESEEMSRFRSSQILMSSTSSFLFEKGVLV